MYVKKLKITRRGGILSTITEVPLCFQKLTQNRKIKRKYRVKGLSPSNEFEAPTFCFVCVKVFPCESHYKVFKHEPELSDADKHTLCLVGRAFVNRFTQAGCKEDYDCKKERKLQMLKQRIQNMYHPGTLKGGNTASDFTKNRNKNARDCNTYLDQKTKERGFVRKLFMNTRNFRVDRSDLELRQNMFCLYCDSWVKGLWIKHMIIHHKKLRPLEELTVKLYSQRLKCLAISQLLVLGTAPPLTNKRFFSQLENYSYILPGEKTEKSDEIALFDDFRRQFRWSFWRKNIVTDSANTIRALGHTSEKDSTLNPRHYVLAYSRLKKWYGSRFGGFIDVWHYRKKNSATTKRAIKRIQAANGGSKDCINFLVYRQNGYAVHTAVSLYRPFDSSVTVFEPMIISDEVYPDYLKDIARYHGHSCSNLKVQFAIGYPVQPDHEYSCCYRALWGAIILLSKGDPCSYEMLDNDITALFNTVKQLVENGGREIKKLTIHQLVAKIARKKTV